jgi:hypothetical protein
MARKQPIGYEVRRPLTLWGKRREIGEFLPAKEVASLARVESLVRSGRFLAVYDETDTGFVARGHRGTRKEVISNPVKAAEPVVEVIEPVVEPVEPVVEPVVEDFKPKRGRPKKVVKEPEDQ